ncbi:MAG: AraC family transcriptional regulator [Polyangiaceae bacterium]
MSPSPTISRVVPLVIAAAAQKEGVDPTPIFAGSGIDPAAPPAPDEQMDVAVYFDVWRRALSLIDDPAFALRAASMFQLEDHEIFGFLAMSCETLGQAYERTAAYRGLYCVGARWELCIEQDATRLVWYPWPGDPRDSGFRAAMDYAVADMEKAIRRLGRGGPRPTAVHLAHTAPRDTSAFTAFYGVTPTYGKRLYELVYPKGLCDLPIASFNSRLREYFEQECRRIIDARAAGTSMVEQVRRQLAVAMDGGDVSQDAIAKKLGLSARSMQRRLAEEGTRWSDVLADVRAEFAKRYLARRSISASEVAYLLGFTEPPAFFKAFKRWTGMTPREFQEGQAA